MNHTRKLLALGLGVVLFGIACLGGSHPLPTGKSVYSHPTYKEMDAWSKTLGRTCNSCHINAFTATTPLYGWTKTHTKGFTQAPYDDCASCHTPGGLTSEGRRWLKRNPKAKNWPR